METAQRRNTAAPERSRNGETMQAIMTTGTPGLTVQTAILETVSSAKRDELASTLEAYGLRVSGDGTRGSQLRIQTSGVDRRDLRALLASL